MAFVLIAFLVALVLASVFGTDSRPGVDDPPQPLLWRRPRT